METSKGKFEKDGGSYYFHATCPHCGDMVEWWDDAITNEDYAVCSNAEVDCGLEFKVVFDVEMNPKQKQKIDTLEKAKEYIQSLFDYKLFFNFDDDAHQIEWDLFLNNPPTKEECDNLNFNNEQLFKIDWEGYNCPFDYIFGEGLIEIDW